jgi:hypothetical protein
VIYAHVYFDTLKFVEKLKASGMSEAQAKALAEVQQESFSDALDTTVATKSDMVEVKAVSLNYLNKLLPFTY